jgi:mannosyltransferase
MSRTRIAMTWETPARAPAVAGARATARDVLADGWVLAAVLAALALRLVELGTAALWYDEVFTVHWTRLGWVDMVRTAVTDNHAPLYFVLTKAWTAIAGVSPTALRVPSVLFSVATVAALAALAAMVAPGRAAARWAAWLAALSPYLLHHAQEARMYALVALLATLHLLALCAFAAGRRDTLGVAYVVTAWALVASHWYGVFLVAGGLLGVALLRRPPRAWLPGATLAAAAMGAAFLLAAFVARHDAGSRYDLGLAAVAGTLWSFVSGYAALPSSEALHAEGLRAALPYVPVAVLGGIPLVVLGAMGLRALGHIGRLALLPPLGLALAGPFLGSVLLGVGINPRYCAPAVPALLVVLAVGAAGARGGLGRLAAVALLLTLAGSSAAHLAAPGHGREDVYAAGRWLDAHVARDEEILVTSEEMLDLAQFHWPGRRLRLYPERGVRVEPDNAERIADALPGAGPRAIWVVGRAWLSDPDGLLERALDARHAPCAGAAVRGVRILCFETGRAGER